MSIGKRIGIMIVIVAWVVFNFLIMGTLTSKKAKRDMKTWTASDKELAFRNARFLVLLLTIATGLLV